MPVRRDVLRAAAVLGHRLIAPVMSIRFGAFFSQTPEFRHSLHVGGDFRAWGKKQKTARRQNPPRPKPRERRVTRLCRQESTHDAVRLLFFRPARVKILSVYSDDTPPRQPGRALRALGRLRKTRDFFSRIKPQSPTPFFAFGAVRCRLEMLDGWSRCRG
mgnify:CR=1 FL=1